MKNIKILLHAQLRNFLPGLAAWMVASSLAVSVSWLQLYICFSNQMSIVNDLLRIMCNTNWYGKYQLDRPI